MTKKETFKWVVQIIASIATAILTATGAGICDKAATRRQNRFVKDTASAQIYTAEMRRPADEM